MEYKGYKIEYNPIIEYWSREEKRGLSNNPYPNCSGGYRPIGIKAKGYVDTYMSLEDAKREIDFEIYRLSCDNQDSVGLIDSNMRDEMLCKE